MKDVIAIINQKGGVGKSTTALGLGFGLIEKGFRILFIDLDAQSNLTFTLNTPTNDISILDLLTKDATIEESIIKSEKWDIISASTALAGADKIIDGVGKEYRLKESLEPIKDNYDYIIIDTPPALGVLTINALTACTKVIIPAQADIYSLQGISQLQSTINAVKQYSNPDLKILGILLTRYNSRAILSRDIADVMEETSKHLDTKLFTTKIREAIAIKESQANRESIYLYAPKSNAAIDYLSFTNEVLERN